MPLVEIRNLAVSFPTVRGRFRAVDGVDLTIEPGELIGLVGESGSGKSLSLLALMGLIGYPGRVTADVLRFDGIDLQGLSARQRRRLIGKDLAMIFQEPMTSLNPCFTVGFQIGEMLGVHEGLGPAQRRHRVVALLEQVGIPAPESRLNAFPHQLSGGMSQRVMIAMAIACNPRLLLADEPTTALDVTVQAQILHLVEEGRDKLGMAILWITHDLGVVGELCDRVLVMYLGQVVEDAPVAAIFEDPKHPYTQGLLACSFIVGERSGEDVDPIAGTVPGPFEEVTGCPYAARCPHAWEQCRETPPQVEHGRSKVRCWLYA